jgi:hypothetical protein
VVGQLPFRIDQFEDAGAPDPVADFARLFGGLLAVLDPGEGWCQVFWSRDPRGMRACADGTETPPWDVVEALLADRVACAAPGPEPGPAAARLRTAYLAALAARDARPGAAAELARGLPGMARARERASARVTGLESELAGVAGPAAEHLRAHLAWARDDLRRAEARCAELTERLARLAPGGGAGRGGAHGAGRGSGAAEYGPGRGAGDAAPQPGRRTAPVREPATGGPAPATAAARGLAPAASTRRRRSARFAGVDDALLEPGGVLPPSGAPAAATAGAGAAPTGARFAGSAASAGRAAAVPDAEGARRAAELLGRLGSLRAEEREGEAHLLLVEAAHWPPAHVCALGARLGAERLAADWSTVLWEAAALPLPRLTALATALDAAGYGADAARILRQGVVRPFQELAAALADPAVTAVPGARERLADSCVSVRSAEDLARVAAADPGVLTAPLLAAAARASALRHEALTHALRVAGVPGAG